MPSRLLRSLGRPAVCALAGLALSLGAPLGLLALRAAFARRLPDFAWLGDQVTADPLLYGYLTVATAAVMSAVGWMVGRYETALSMLSDLDPLTRLPNRRGFDAALERELSRATRDRAPLTAMMIDLDRFKSVNDRFGHAAGDAALLQVGDCLRECCRKTDVAARYGGDEFSVLLPATRAVAAQRLAARLAATLRARPPVAARAAPVTLSIGIAELEVRDGRSGEERARGEGSRGAELMARADRALYAAKKAGRDRAVVAGRAEAAGQSSRTGPDASGVDARRVARLGAGRET